MHAGHLLHLCPPSLHSPPHRRYPRLLRRPQEHHQDTSSQVRGNLHYSLNIVSLFDSYQVQGALYICLILLVLPFFIAILYHHNDKSLS